MAKTLSTAALAAFALTSTLGCTELKDGEDRQPLPAEWACLAGQQEPPVYDPPVEWVAYVAPVVDFANPPSPVPGLKAELCGINDPDCALHPGQFLGGGPVPTDVEGVPFKVDILTFVVPYGTKAYLRLTAPNYLTQEYYFGGPIIGTPELKTVTRSAREFGFPVDVMVTAALVEGLPFTLVSNARADSLAEQVGEQRDKTRAIVGVRTINCFGELAAGVTLSLGEVAKEDALPFAYVLDNLLRNRPSAKDGLAGFANIRLPNVGIYAVTVKGIAPTGNEYGEIAMNIRPNQMTAAEIRPFSSVWGR